MPHRIDIVGVGALEVLMTERGDQIGVLVGRDRSWLVVYGRQDPDAALVAVELSDPEVGQLVGALGAARGQPPAEDRVIVACSLRDALDELRAARP